MKLSTILAALICAMFALCVSASLSGCATTSAPPAQRDIEDLRAVAGAFTVSFRPDDAAKAAKYDATAHRIAADVKAFVETGGVDVATLRGYVLSRVGDDPQDRKVADLFILLGGIIERRLGGATTRPASDAAVIGLVSAAAEGVIDVTEAAK